MKECEPRNGVRVRRLTCRSRADSVGWFSLETARHVKLNDLRREETEVLTFLFFQKISVFLEIRDSF